MGWGNNMMYGWGYGPGVTDGYWWMGLLGMLLQAIFWIGIIALGFFLYKRYNSRLIIRNGSFYRDGPLDILRERYARGEIDSEEYQRRKADLDDDDR